MHTSEEETSLRLLSGLVNGARIQCANPAQLVRALGFVRTEGDPSLLQSRLSAATLDDIEAEEVGGPDAGPLILADARKIAGFISELLSSESGAIAFSLDSAVTSVEVFAEHLGLQGTLNVRVVDFFPSPYDRMSWSAMAPDAEDQRLYDIEPGIYVRKERVSAFSTSLSLAHEAVHSAAGARPEDAKLLARGLEEGLCDVVGTAAYGIEAYGHTRTFNYLVNRRLRHGKQGISRTYIDNFRLGVAALDRFGWEGCVVALRGGRTAVKTLEHELLGRGTSLGTRMDDSVGGPDGLDSLVRAVALSFPGGLVVTPCALRVAEFASAGSTVETIGEKTGLDLGTVRRALEELQTQVFVLSGEDGRVDYSDAPELYKLGVLRYRL